MTLEELQAKVQELSESNEALVSKNRELLGEVKRFKSAARGAEISPDEFDSVKSQLEETKAELAKTQRTLKAETEKATKQLSEKDSALQKYLIDGGLSDALSKAGIAPQYMDAVKALLKAETAISVEDGNYKPTFKGKDLLDGIKEWSGSEQGKFFVSAPANSGGGALGGNGSKVTSNPWAKDSLNLTEQVRLSRENPELASRMKAQAQS